MKSTIFQVKLLLLLLGNIFVLVTASVGDQSPEFFSCTSVCQRQCTSQPPHYPTPISWDCPSECRYNCMWTTIQQLGFTPQFYGKWPFVRILGVQEPASALASVLNFYTNIHMLKKLVRQQYQRSPFKYLWYSYALVCLNAWFWSTVFHTRDTQFTQKFDYIGSFSMVLFQFYSFFVRVLWLRNSNILFTIITSIFIWIFVSHAVYLSTNHFDFKYNMIINVVIGVSTCVCWLCWFGKRYFLDKAKYVWRGALSVVLFASTFILEICDFAPIMFVLDAHSIWHFSTIIIPVFWYQFQIDDSYFIERQDIVKQVV